MQLYLGSMCDAHRTLMGRDVIRALTIIDTHTRLSPVVEVRQCITCVRQVSFRSTNFRWPRRFGSPQNDLAQQTLGQGSSRGTVRVNNAPVLLGQENDSSVR